MKITLSDLSPSLQLDMFSQLRWVTLQGFLRLAKLPPQASKKAAAEALVACGKFATRCEFHVGIQTESTPDYQRLQELDAWFSSVEILESDVDSYTPPRPASVALPRPLQRLVQRHTTPV
jgi:hypothetical protein